VFPQVGINIRVLGPGEPMWTYPVDETAIRHGAGVEEETTDAAVAYGRFEPSVPLPYEEGWLPG
jgi:hypothetical protein